MTEDQNVQPSAHSNDREQEGKERAPDATAHSGRDAKETERKPDDYERKPDARLSRFMTFFTFVIAAATIVQAWTSFHQFQAFRLDARAWVGVVPTTALPLAPNQEMLFRTMAKNFGKSPAFRIAMRTYPTLGQKPRPRLQRQHGQPTFSLIPGEESSGFAIVQQMPTAAVDDVRGGTQELYVWIEVLYDDPFRENRYSRNCHHWAPNFVTPDGSKGAWKPCAGNDDIYE